MKKAYIKDIQDNYYTINERDELVIASSKAEAHIFQKCDALKRIGSGKKARFYKVEEEKCVNNQVITNVDNEGGKSFLKLIVNSWSAMGMLFTDAYNKMSEYQTELNKKQSIIDKEISDIYHFIEFFDGEEEKLLNATNLLKDRLRKRRIIKDEIARLAILGDTILDDKFMVQIANANKRMSKMDERKYSPRILESLFEDCNFVA